MNEMIIIGILCGIFAVLCGIVELIECRHELLDALDRRITAYYVARYAYKRARTSNFKEKEQWKNSY